MDISYFPYIAGVASVASFIFQAADFFPQRKTGLRYASFLFFGIFAGGLINAFDASSIKLDFVITGFYLLAGVMGIVSLIFFAIYIFSNSQKRREEYIVIAAMVGLMLLAVVGINSCTMDDPTYDRIQNEKRSISNENSRISINELSLLAEEAIRKENFERALMHLESIKSRLSYGDVRYKKIEQQIEETKKKQF